jgi:hypothetical protein
MIEVKNTPEGILVNVSGSAKDLANELRLLTKQIINHPTLNRALQASIYSAGGIEYVKDLVEQYGIWVEACQTVDEMEGSNESKKSL